MMNLLRVGLVGLLAGAASAQTLGITGVCCARCDSADFNGDGSVGTDGDIEAFFRVLAGGAC
jgi:hypothetical protein